MLSTESKCYQSITRAMFGNSLNQDTVVSKKNLATCMFCRTGTTYHRKKNIHRYIARRNAVILLRHDLDGAFSKRKQKGTTPYVQP